MLKNSSLISGLLGAIVGAGGVMGVQTFCQDSGRDSSKVAVEHQSAFEHVLDNPNGPYVVTRHGEKFHDPGCHYLTESPSSNIKHVTEEDARAEGYMPCSNCLSH